MPGSERNSGKNKSASPIGDDMSDDWQRVTKSTRQLSKKQKVSYQAERLSKPAKRVSPKSTNMVNEPAPIPTQGPTLTPRSSISPAPALQKPIVPKATVRLEKLDHKELRRMRRGRDPVEQTLDLHGLRANVAQRRVETFIRAAHSNGCKWVLIITGKGVQGEGTLKKQAPLWLGALAQQGLVLGFDHAPSNMGGSGAVCVRLRKKRHNG